MDDTPFSVSPNPLTLYRTPAVDAALFKVRFTINKRQGLTALLGDNGLGKSTLVRYLYAEYDSRPDTTAIFVPTPSYTSEFAMMQSLCREVNLPVRRSILKHQEELFGLLVSEYTEKRNVVLFIDEAQRLTNKMLEVVRTLLNYETNEHKLIQVVLSGQLELRDRLLSDKQKALRSRLIAPTVLSPLSLDDMTAMLEHRCQLSKIKMPFDASTLEQLYMVTDGVPRAVLAIALYAYEISQTYKLPITPKSIDDAVKEVSLKSDE